MLRTSSGGCLQRTHSLRVYHQLPAYLSQRVLADLGFPIGTGAYRDTPT
jgi:hypothetical protein